MEIERSTELIPPHRIETLPDVLSETAKRPRDLSVLNPRFSQEEDVRLSISSREKGIRGYELHPQTSHTSAEDNSFHYSFGQETDSFNSWVKTVKRIEDGSMLKGTYIDTFI